MVVLKLNEKGIFLTTMILSILTMITLINMNISTITMIILTPMIYAINLIISSNIKLITKKELVKPAKVQN